MGRNTRGEYNKRFGNWGERQAALFLLEKGYRMVEKNAYMRFGEIDIIAIDESEEQIVLVFIEVKTRRGVPNGMAERATGYRKQKNMKRAALKFCLQRKISIETTPMRFEQISIYVIERHIDIRHYILPI
ncbi:MAG: YraN family protein [Candidatus Magasanikbacteria bacterium]|jgi:putative endonuclease|nr:YraN family protein [Candidatus Magasanikbacteria bacterium]